MYEIVDINLGRIHSTHDTLDKAQKRATLDRIPVWEIWDTSWDIESVCVDSGHILSQAKPLSIPFNVAVLHIVSRILPYGFDVSSEAPQNFDSLMAHYRKTGRICVWNGASDKTIFADCEINFAFRAWHDSKHIIGRFPFTREGELQVLAMQKADILAIYNGRTADLFCSLLDAEIRGQFDYKECHGGFPVDQAAFALAYIAGGFAAAIGPCPRFGLSAEAA